MRRDNFEIFGQTQSTYLGEGGRCEISDFTGSFYIANILSKKTKSKFRYRLCNERIEAGMRRYDDPQAASV